MVKNDFVIQLGAEVDRNAGNDVKKQIDRIVKEQRIPNLQLDLEQNSEFVVKDMKQIQTIVNDVNKVVTMITANVGGITKLYKDVWQSSDLEEPDFLSIGTSLRQQIQSTGKEMEAVQKRLTQAMKSGSASAIDVFKKQLETIKSEMSSLEKQYQEIVGKTDAKDFVKTQKAGYSMAAKSMYKWQSEEQAKKESHALQEYQRHLEKLNQHKLQYAKLEKKLKKANAEEKSSIYELLDSYDKLIKEEQTEADVQRQNIATSEGQAKANRMEAEQNVKLKRELLESGRSYEDNTQSVFGLSEMIVNQLVNRAMMMLSAALKNSIAQVKELNKAMTDVQMVTGATSSETARMAKEYQQMASELGATTEDMARGASDWLRQGKSQAETIDLLTASTIQSKIGMIEASQSTELLTSTLNGFKLEAKDAMHVVDALQAVDLAAATSVEEIALALQKTANSGRVAGVEFEILVGYIAAVSEATRQAPEIVGTSFKTLFSRYSNVAAGKDIDDFGESIDICGIQA